MMIIYFQQRRDSAAPERKIITMNRTIPAKDPIKDPEIRSQKELNCWQIANQFVLAFPLCAKYTMAAAAEAPAVKRAIIPCSQLYKTHELRNYRVQEDQQNPSAMCSAPQDVEYRKRKRKNQVATYNGVGHNKEAAQTPKRALN